MWQIITLGKNGLYRKFSNRFLLHQFWVQHSHYFCHLKFRNVVRYVIDDRHVQIIRSLVEYFVESLTSQESHWRAGQKFLIMDVATSRTHTEGDGRRWSWIMDKRKGTHIEARWHVPRPCSTHSIPIPICTSGFTESNKWTISLASDRIYRSLIRSTHTFS